MTDMLDPAVAMRPSSGAAPAFFDDCRLVAAVEERVLPALVRDGRRSGRRLRVWSAACAGGEDAYLIAIALRRLLPDLADWRISLYASDPDPAVLRRARRASFADEAFRDAPHGFRQRHFRRRVDGWALLPPVRRMVDFVIVDLLQDRVPSLLNHTVAHDLIVCRGLLPTLPPSAAGGVLQRLAGSLRDDGWLLLGSEETLPPLPAQLQPVRCAGAVLLRRLPTPRPALTPIDEAPDAALEAAMLAYRRGDVGDAAARIGRVLDQGDAGVAALELAVRIEAQQGRLLEALALCQHAIALQPQRPQPHHLRACVLVEQGALGEAMQAFQRALYLDPGFLLAHFGLGSLARRLGRNSEAERHFANALALARALPPALVDGDGVSAGRLVELILAQQEGLRERDGD